MRRFIGATIALALVFASASSAKSPAPSWAQSELKLLVARGLMPKGAASRPDELITHGELAELLGRMSENQLTLSLDPAALVTMAQLDAKLVAALGLSPSASRLLRAARAADLKPPARFGTEVLARLLGLRTNHPVTQDTLELRHDEPATRAEAAYSAARILRFRSREVEAVETAASTFNLPAYDPWQKRYLTTSVGLIGLPYIWGGTSERPQAPFGVQVNGGFDCSGFVWRVFKQPRSGSGALTASLKGRTAAAMAGEVAQARRIPFARLRPADLVFFGPGGPRSKPAEVDHMGIALGNGWMIHSSRYGVAVVPLTGWYSQHFAWGRRPLAEAGLSSAEIPAATPPGIR